MGRSIVVAGVRGRCRGGVVMALKGVRWAERGAHVGRRQALGWAAVGAMLFAHAACCGCAAVPSLVGGVSGGAAQVRDAAGGTWELGYTPPVTAGAWLADQVRTVLIGVGAGVILLGGLWVVHNRAERRGRNGAAAQDGVLTGAKKG